MVDEELQKQITALVAERKMETTDRLLINYVEHNPYDIDGCNRTGNLGIGSSDCTH